LNSITDVFSTGDTLNTFYNIYGILDNGMIGSVSTTRRGVKLTGAKALVPSKLRVYVPPMDQITNYYEPFVNMLAQPTTNEESTAIKNSIVVTVTAKKGENGVPAVLTTTVPKGTTRGTSILLSDNLFDRVIDVTVSPGNIEDLEISDFGADGKWAINWSVYDLITVETSPR
jgi:hypothetical protein